MIRCMVKMVPLYEQYYCPYAFHNQLIGLEQGALTTFASEEQPYRELVSSDSSKVTPNQHHQQ